jgi:hypothetical protein
MMIARGVSSPQYGEVAGFRVFFFLFVRFCDEPTAQTRRPIFTLDTSNDVIWLTYMPFGNHIDEHFHLGVI